MANASFAPQKFSWWWESIIDLMLADPHLTKAQIAEKLSCTPTYIYMITGSDLFQARFAQRRAALNSELNDRLTGRLASVADQSLSIIADVLSKKQDTIPLPALVDLADKTLTRLGYGVKEKGPSVVVNANPLQVSVSVEDLNEARAALRRSEEAKLIEHEAVMSLPGDPLEATSSSSGVGDGVDGPELRASGKASGSP